MRFSGETDLLVVSESFPEHTGCLWASSHGDVLTLSVQGEGVIYINYDPGSVASIGQCVKESHQRVRSVTPGTRPRVTLRLQSFCTSPVMSILSQQSHVTIKMERHHWM